MITHLEPDILEFKVKWALGSITTNKASGGDGSPVQLFQILKDDAVKVLHSICQQIWKTQQWSEDWKRLVFIPIPKKSNAEECSNYCRIALISHARKAVLKILQARLQQYMNQELPYVQAGFRRQRNQRSNCQHLLDHQKSKRIPEKYLLYWLHQSLYCVDHNKLWKILKEMGISDHLTCLLRNLYQVRKQQLETDKEQKTGSKLGKGYIKAVYCHPAYLTYVQNTSWETLGCMTHKLESRLLGEISTTSDMQMTPP